MVQVVNEVDQGDINTKTSGETGGKREKTKDQERFFTKEINFSQGVQVLIAFFTSAC